jgi:Flp pilus assembly pilin Flp
MNILKLAKTFKNDESGAVTVDWVVLTAAIVGLGLAVLTTIGDGIADRAKVIATAVESGSNPTFQTQND